MYSLVIGVLAAVALAILVLAMKMQDLTQGVYTRDTDEYQRAVLERIQPVGQVYLPGEQHAAAAPTVDTPAQPEPVATVLTGPQVYNTACSACHGAGIGGAPILGDAAQWVERIAQGEDTLIRHATEGFTGSAGYMPPKGGRMDLSDGEIADAVAFMIGEVNQAHPPSFAGPDNAETALPQHAAAQSFRPAPGLQSSLRHAARGGAPWPTS